MASLLVNLEKIRDFWQIDLSDVIRDYLTSFCLPMWRSSILFWFIVQDPKWQHPSKSSQPKWIKVLENQVCFKNTIPTPRNILVILMSDNRAICDRSKLNFYGELMKDLHLHSNSQFSFLLCEEYNEELCHYEVLWETSSLYFKNLNISIGVIFFIFSCWARVLL